MLVTNDMLGLFDRFRPKFVKRYAELGAEMEKAVAAYAAEVRGGRFPAEEHRYEAKPRGRRAGGAPESS